MKSLYKIISIAFFCLLNLSCDSNIRDKPQSEKISENTQPKEYNCDTKKLDSLLVQYSENFIPTKIGLDECLPSSFDTLFNNIDTICLRSLPHYKYSILIVLLKLYDYHIRVGHQGYDLYSMKSGASKIIIGEFESIGGYTKERLEMLNSGTVLDVIDKEDGLKTNPVIKKYYDQINVAIKEQEKGKY